jgi:hypothetical protein
VTLAATGQEPRPRGGRPLLLTRDTLDAIVEAVEQGSYLKIAAQAAGVSQSTLAAWLARGRVAAALVADHAADRLYCPACGHDRTDDARSVEEHNAAEYASRHAEEGTVPYAVLGPCPDCRSDRDPEVWTLPDDEAPFLELLESVTRAQASAETQAVAAWRRAFSGHEPDWRAARDYLARVAPERWAGVTRVQMTTEEAERRIDDAVNEALLSLGVDALTDEDDDALDEPGEQEDS